MNLLNKGGEEEEGGAVRGGVEGRGTMKGRPDTDAAIADIVVLFPTTIKDRG